MRIFMTGATGFLGAHIAREVVRVGHDLRILVRKKSKLDGLSGIKYEAIEGDICLRSSVESGIRGVDAVIHAAGNVSPRRRHKDALYRVNVEGTRNVLTAALAQGGLRVVHTSSIVAVGASLTPSVMNEETPWSGGGEGYHYVDSKRQGEDIARELAQAGLKVVILNPGLILGPGDIYLTSTRYVLEYLKGHNRFALPGGLSFCDVRDVAKAHVAALTKGRVGERYIVAGNNVSHRDALSTMYRMTGLGRPFSIPVGAATFAALLAEGLSLAGVRGLEDLNRPFVRYTHLYSYFDVSKARRELGYEVRPFEETVADTVRDFLARGIFPAKTKELLALAQAVPSGAPAEAVE